MVGSLRRFVMVAAALAWPLCASAQSAAVQVTGDEIEAWFSADQMAVAGVVLASGCHWLTKGPKAQRSQTVHCPNEMPFTVTGEARIEGHRLCSKFSYPNGTRLDACQDIFRIGDNKYEIRVDGVARNVFYRLVR